MQKAIRRSLILQYVLNRRDLRAGDVLVAQADVREAFALDDAVEFVARMALVGRPVEGRVLIGLSFLLIAVDVVRVHPEARAIEDLEAPDVAQGLRKCRSEEHTSELQP